MHIQHWVRRESSGLFRTTLELAVYEQKQGHTLTLREPSNSAIIHGEVKKKPDVELVHSQLAIDSYFNTVPKFMWMHGEPLSSVGNRTSMKAIADLAPLMDAFICMREEEHSVWNSIKRTYRVPKGIDLEVFKPINGVIERLSGEPAVLYIENWRGQRNPLYLCKAMEIVWQTYPNARLHLYNCNDKRMNDTFQALIKTAKWWPFIRTLKPGVPHNRVNQLYNQVDIVVSCLYPLYARSIEAFGAGRAFIGPGYAEADYPWTCELSPESMAEAIINCWENYDQIDYRKWAETHHDVAETVRQSIAIYERYL